MKKLIMAVLVALFNFAPLSVIASQWDCLDFVYVYVGMEDKGGFVEVYYVDSHGDSRMKTFERESGYVYVDTDYTVLLIARPYDGYYFLGWGDDDLQRTSIELYVCDDIFFVPRFHKIGDCCEDDDDYNRFIQSLD